ncbi:DUF3153 domain-containing protein [Synechococcus sp. CBW1107]|uniref:DUF3153 domain-containing protein n=1 Tax=Synechococcus sp. CBW1107 TaxID=2789857 RepID=UPI002AD469C0|nr:DUF3153 domain-containing protein [Synechococcus sp. CBW1107]CAK6691865.1 hypothetical protein IFHNHDMJ_01102 [Synechococcus sp. CBW1107]
MEGLSGAGLADDPLAAARRGLERGDYGQVLRLLEPLAALHSPRTALGGEVRLLMTTALMGQGQSERAQACCRELLRCNDPLLRTQARDLLLVLEAPALSRPRDWSLTLPELGDAPSLEGSRAAALRRRANSGPPPPPPPPVGATRAPIGFAALVIALVLLALGLGGCMQVRSDLHFEGPGRLRLEHHLRSDSGRITPWQRQFALALEAEGFRHVRSGGEEQLIGSVQPASAALAQLARNLELASQLGGVPLPPPQLVLRERNWGLGVRQELQLELDLRNLATVPGLDLGLNLAPVRPSAVRLSTPLATRSSRQPGGQLWPLQAGALNRLELRCWRWSPLGLGGASILLLLLLVSLLQWLRRRAGFGWPELPA